MRIAYVARFDAGGNCDEQAIAHALRQLGHEVECYSESRSHRGERVHGDLLLFHKLCDPELVEWFRGGPRVMWYWDLVDYPSDPTLARRSRGRVRWMQTMLPHVDLGFCSDGDWVAADTTGKLVWLPQGADGRVVGAGTPRPGLPPILFTGIRCGGQQRASFVDEMRAKYGDAFRHVERGVHGRELADLIAGSQIVVAPDGPVTSLYWSNRVYNTLGFGGFLLHPYCAQLVNFHYTGMREIVFYRDRTELHDLIAHYLDRPTERQRVAAAGLERTRNEHLYLHRVEKLLRVVKERLL